MAALATLHLVTQCELYSVLFVIAVSSIFKTWTVTYCNKVGTKGADPHHRILTSHHIHTHTHQESLKTQ